MKLSCPSLLKAATKVIDGLGRAGAQSICAAARNIELVFTNNEADVIAAGYELIEATFGVRAPPELDWDAVAKVNGKAVRQFGQMVKE